MSSWPPCKWLWVQFNLESYYAIPLTLKNHVGTSSQTLGEGWAPTFSLKMMEMTSIQLTPSWMKENKYLLGLGEILIWVHVLSASKSGNEFFYWLVCPLPNQYFPKHLGDARIHFGPMLMYITPTCANHP